ncbi:hypothetical protein LCGC14_1614420 [marine sediment metagenome]|uniref:Uncharacterized protein n=1 Tax=marine sediment metagenome TaxID=412755 RepID=A0A0F9I7N9_9ZZZZ
MADTYTIPAHEAETCYPMCSQCTAERRDSNERSTIQTLKQANKARRVTGQPSFDIITTTLPWNIREVTPNGIWFTTSDGLVFVTNTTITNLKNLMDAARLYRKEHHSQVRR